MQQVTENDIQEFKTMMAQLSKVLGGVLSEKLTVSISDWTSTASVLTIDGKRKFSYGSKVRSKPEFFDEVSPTDVRSLKFVSNFLSHDDSAKIENLYDSLQSSAISILLSGDVEQVMNLPDLPSLANGFLRGHYKEEPIMKNDPAWIFIYKVPPL